MSESSDGPTTEWGRWRLDLSYDGSNFRGFAVNHGVRTVQAELSGALERVLGGAVRMTCAGRTDAGVHARGQVVSFDAPGPVLPDRLQRSLNLMLGPEIAVESVQRVPDAFSARFDATGRRYLYRVLNRPVHDPLLASLVWHVHHELDVEAMNTAAECLIGTHDFAAFCKRHLVTGTDGIDRYKTTTRRVGTALWRQHETTDGDAGLLIFTIEASAFCHQMVRSIVGTLVRVGSGKLTPDDMTHILQSRERTAANSLAPPHGLVLDEVEYPTSEPVAIPGGDGRVLRSGPSDL